MKFLQDVLKEIRPKGDALKNSQQIVDRLNDLLKKSRVDAVSVVGGSVAKNTHIKYYDCDIFVKFSLNYKGEDISKVLEKVIRPMKPEVLHGSRDYFQVTANKTVYEIIPVLDVKNPIQADNVTDMSPMHIEWVKSNIKNLADDIRLAKVFCKAQGVYGAESYINGFSGYMVEILVIHYNGFQRMINGVANWRPRQVIDVKGYYLGESVFNSINKSKLQSPIVVIDPVQKERNAAAALSEDKFGKFVLAAKRFIEKPSKDFFYEKEFSINDLKRESKYLGTQLIVLEVVPQDGRKDAVGSKLIQAWDHIKKWIDIYEFKVFDHGWHWSDSTNKAYFWYMTYPKELPAFKKHPGPLVHSGDVHVKKFIEIHKNVMIENSRLFAKVKREFTTVKDCVKHVIKDSFMKEHVKTIRIIK